MKTKTKLIGGVVVAIIIGLLAYKKMNAEELSHDFFLGYNSELSFRGVTTSDSAIQSSVSLGTKVLGTDVSIGALTNIKDSAQNEVQVSVDASLSVVDWVETSVGVVSYDNNAVLGDDTEVYADFGLDLILNPKVRLYYNPSEDDVTVEGAVSHGLNLTEKISIEAVASVGNTPVGDERATYYGVDLVGGYSISEKLQAFVGVDLVELKDISLASPEVGVYGGVSYRF